MAEESVFMLNVLWFKENGAEAYAKYAAAAGPIVSALGGKRIFGFTPTETLIGDWQPDLLFVVEWPSWEALKQLGEKPDYQEIAHMREVGLDRSLLIRCSKMS